MWSEGLAAKRNARVPAFSMRIINTYNKLTRDAITGPSKHIVLQSGVERYTAPTAWDATLVRFE